MVEKNKLPEGLSDDTVAGALARRKALLNVEKFTDWERLQIQTCMLGVPTTEARATDKITSQQLFRRQYPERQKLRAAIESATGSLTLYCSRKASAKSQLKITAPTTSAAPSIETIVVHRLPDANWVEPKNGHYITPSFPWAQILEDELQWRIEEQAKSQGSLEGTSPEKPAEPRTGLFTGAIAKVLGRTG